MYLQQRNVLLKITIFPYGKMISMNFSVFKVARKKFNFNEADKRYNLFNKFTNHSHSVQMIRKIFSRRHIYPISYHAY